MKKIFGILIISSMIFFGCKKEVIENYSPNFTADNGTEWVMSFNSSGNPNVAGVRIIPSYQVAAPDTVFYQDSLPIIIVDTLLNPIDTTYSYFINDSTVPRWDKNVDIVGYDDDGGFTAKVFPSQDNASGMVSLGSLNLEYTYPSEDTQSFRVQVTNPNYGIVTSDFSDAILCGA